jgi:hypothetical protein
MIGTSSHHRVHSLTLFSLLSLSSFSKDELKEKEITIKNGDSKQLRIIQLENSLLQQKKTFARNFSKLRIAHRNEMQSIDVQMSMLRKDADQRASAVKENAGLKRDLSS